MLADAECQDCGSDYWDEIDMCDCDDEVYMCRCHLSEYAWYQMATVIIPQKVLDKHEAQE